MNRTDKIDKIYVLTMIEDIATTKQLSNKRALGWYPTKKDAVKAVKEDKCGLRECLYDYALIEAKVSGAFTTSTGEWWFKWDDETHGYISFDKPEWLRMFTNFGMG
jgi:hypothetical protein